MRILVSVDPGDGRSRNLLEPTILIIEKHLCNLVRLKPFCIFPF